MSAEIQQPNGAEAHYQLFNRVLNYPVVTSALESAKGYYSAAKSSSDLVKKSCESVEYRLNESVKWISPKVEPVLPYAEPLLNTVDGFGCRQLDRIEKINEAYHTSKQLLEARVNEIKTNTLAAAEAGKQTLEERVVPGVDQYLKESYLLGAPVNLALNVTEKVADRLLPAVQEEQSDESSSKKQRKGDQQQQSSSENQQQQITSYTYDGPIYRAGKLSKRLQQSLRNLNLRPQEKLNAMQYCVDLIQYATENFDKTVQLSNQFISDKIPSINFAEVSEKVSNSASDAFKAVQTATEVLRTHVPEAIQALPQNFQVNFQEKMNELKSKKGMQSFVELCNKNINRLQEANNLLTEYIKSNNSIPQQLVIVTQKVNNVLESLTIDVNTDQKAIDSKENSKKKE